MNWFLKSWLVWLASAGLAGQLHAQDITNKLSRTFPPVLNPAPVRPAPVGAGVPNPARDELIRLPAVVEMTNGILAFDRETQEVVIADGAPEARFVFSFTNVSIASLTITNVALSCGCLTVETPPLPWVLEPVQSGLLPVILEVAGKKPGVVTKILQVRTDRGMKTLMVKADVRPPPEVPD